MRLPRGLKIALALLAGASGCRAADIVQPTDSARQIAEAKPAPAGVQNGYAQPRLATASVAPDERESEQLRLHREPTHQDAREKPAETSARALTSEANELAVLKQLTSPSSEDERTAECSWIRSEYDRQQYLQQNLRKQPYSQAEAASWDVAISKVEGALLALRRQAGCA